MLGSYQDLTVRLRSVLTRDLFPEAAPYLNRVCTPLGSLCMAALVAGLFGLFLHAQAFLALIGILAIVIQGVAWPWLTTRGLEGSIGFDSARAREGDSVSVRLRLRNRLPWGACGLTVKGGFDLLEGGSEHGPAVLSLAHARGWRSAEVTWRFTPGCRGFYPREVPRIASRFPFGIWESSRSLNAPTPLLVWPRTFPVGPIPEAAGQRVCESHATVNKPGTNGDFLGVKAYRRGDSLRRIHWPQSARHGQLVVCEVQAIAVPWIQIVLDVDAKVHQGTGSNGSREWAIRIAASFLDQWIREGAETELVVGERRIVPRGGALNLRRTQMLDALAVVGPNAELGLADLLDLPACRQFEGGLRIVITTDRGASALQAQIPRGVVERFVVLDSGAFASGASPAAMPSLPITPWIWVDDPNRVPQRVRHGWKEVACAC